MKWYEWIFDGIGTTFISVIIGFISYKAAIKKMSQQVQKAGDNSKQNQRIDIVNNNCSEDETVVQVQKAGNNTEQTQIGSIYDGK